MMSVGILGLGTFLPPDVRTNEWWPSHTVAAWSDRSAARVTRGDAPDGEAMAPGARRTLEMMARYAKDPFRGAVQRYVMSDGMTVNEMEAAAARDAIQRAGVSLDQIDVILTQTPVAEHLFVNGACPTHRLLGLPKRCMALATEAACNGFAMHVSLARGLIASGQARHVLSIQSSAMTRIVGSAEPDSAWWGDGAAAVVFGPVSQGKGVLSAVHHADGSSCNALVLGVEGRRWWDDGRITLHHGDRGHTRAMLFGLADRAGGAISSALSEVGLSATDVGFYASHQGTAWLTELTAECAGLAHAKTIVTFPSFGNLNSANIPFILAMAEREGMVSDGTVVATFSGGVGETWSSLCMRWGR